MGFSKRNHESIYRKRNTHKILNYLSVNFIVKSAYNEKKLAHRMNFIKSATNKSAPSAGIVAHPLMGSFILICVVKACNFLKYHNIKYLGAHDGDSFVIRM